MESHHRFRQRESCWLDVFSVAFFPTLLENCEGEGYEFFLSTSIAKAFFEKSLNATVISLIPKVSGAVDIKNFRPISLVASV